jgi:hypothetical protein
VAGREGLLTLPEFVAVAGREHLRAR